MKKTFFFAFFFSALSSFGQATLQGVDGGSVFILNKNSSETSAKVKRGSFVGDHVLGDSIAFALNKFEAAHVFYETSSGAYPVEREVIRKPVLYKKMKLIEKYYSNQVVKGKILPIDARRKLYPLLILGEKLVKYDTEKVEKDLKGIKDALQIEDYLKKIRLSE